MAKVEELKRRNREYQKRRGEKLNSELELMKEDFLKKERGKIEK